VVCIDNRNVVKSMFIFFIFEYNVGIFMAFGIIAITCRTLDIFCTLNVNAPAAYRCTAVTPCGVERPLLEIGESGQRLYLLQPCFDSF